MDLFQNYASHTNYDEMFHPDKTVREHWRYTYEAIQRAGIDALEAKQAEIEWHMEDNGVTYNVYNNPDGNTNRIGRPANFCQKLHQIILQLE